MKSALYKETIYFKRGVNMKKLLSIILSTVLVFSIVSCGNKNSDTEVKNNTKDEGVESSAENETGKENSDSWGIKLYPEKVSATGLTLICRQSGGSPTGDLQTGSFYFIEKQVGNDWVEVDMIPSEYERAWTEEAWIIPMDSSVEWDVNWKDVYGELPEGSYRIAKKVHDFRKTADYDEKIYYADFEILG